MNLSDKIRKHLSNRQDLDIIKKLEYMRTEVTVLDGYPETVNRPFFYSIYVVVPRGEISDYAERESFHQNFHNSLLVPDTNPDFNESIIQRVIGFNYMPGIIDYKESVGTMSLSKNIEITYNENSFAQYLHESYGGCLDVYQVTRVYVLPSKPFAELFHAKERINWLMSNPDSLKELSISHVDLFAANARCQKRDEAKLQRKHDRERKKIL